jgi:uncharacterized protein YjbJ (UPF0337 family)
LLDAQGAGRFQFRERFTVRARSQEGITDRGVSLRANRLRNALFFAVREIDGIAVAAFPPARKCASKDRRASRSTAMNWERLEGSLRQMTGRLKQQWGRILSDTATQTDGQHEELIGKIQQAYGISRDDAERQINDWETRH